jgi:hypothetical protein
MTNFQAALIHGLNVLGHVALSAAVTGVFAWVNHNPVLLIYTPLVNVAEAFVWKWVFPNDPFPTTQH